MLLHIWNLPNEMTRETVLLQRAVLLQMWNTGLLQQCVGPDLAHFEIFAKILHDCRVLQSPVSGLTSEIHQQVYFSVLINRTISEI